MLTLGPLGVTAYGGSLGVLSGSRTRAPPERLLGPSGIWRCQALVAAEVAAVVRLGPACVALGPQTVPTWSGPGWAQCCRSRCLFMVVGAGTAWSVWLAVLVQRTRVVVVLRSQC